jgi:hypothetical protein
MKNMMLFYPFTIALTAVVASFVLSNLFGISGFRAMPYGRAFSVVVCGIFLSLFLINSKLKPKINRDNMFKLVLVLQAFSVVYLLIGLARSNTKLYLVTDFFYLTLFFLTMLLGARAYKKYAINYNHDYFVKLIIYIFFALAFLPLFKIGMPTDLMLLWVCAFTISVAQKNNAQVALLVIGLLPQLPGVNRAFVLVVLAASVLLFITSGLTRKVKIAVFAVIGITVFVAVFNSTDFFQGTNLERRVNETIFLAFEENKTDLPIPIQQRVYEGQLLFKDLQNSFLPISSLFGLGHGYTLDMTYSIDFSVISSQLLGGEATHNIHFLHYALLARFGVLGFVAYLCIFILAAKRSFNLLRLKTVKDNNLGLLANLYIFFLFIFSMPASSFLFSSLVLGFFCGVSSQSFAKKLRS